MSKQILPAADLRGLSSLTIDAVLGITQLAEAVHLQVLDNIGKTGLPAKPVSKITRFVYRSIALVTRGVGGSLDMALARLMPLLGSQSQWPGREVVVAALNGVLGDYLAASHNPLAIHMHFRLHGKPLNLPALPASDINGRLLVMVHGLCMSDTQWLRKGHDHGMALARDKGYTPVYLRYNSGLHISSNGQAFAAQLEELIQHWPVPVEELVIVGHSMGGLVTRSAFAQAQQAGMNWTKKVSKLVFLASPHHGAPLERGGNWFHLLTSVSSYSAPFSRLGKIRSAGITDLRYGNLLDQDWQGRDRFAHDGDLRQPVPLPQGVPCFALAATQGKQVGDLSDAMLGDGLVPVNSALGLHANPAFALQFAPERQWIGYELHHLEVLNRADVYAQLLQWL